MKKNRCLSFKYITAAVVFLIFFRFQAFASESPFIPKSKAVGVVGLENFPSADKYENFYYYPFCYGKETYFSDLSFYKIRETAAFSGNNDRMPVVAGNIAVFNKAPDDGSQTLKPYSPAASLYLKTEGRYFDISGEPSTSALSGGLSAAFYSGLDRYKDAGFVDFGAAASSALMAASSYAGLTAGNYAADNIFSPVFSSSLGAGFTGFLGDAAGGVAGGALFAVGSYVFGMADRHTAMLMITKSAVGSAASAGMTAILGSGASAAGLAAVGPYVFPVFTALAAGYVVEKLFELADREEEKERIGDLLNKISEK